MTLPTKLREAAALREKMTPGEVIANHDEVCVKETLEHVCDCHEAVAPRQNAVAVSALVNLFDTPTLRALADAVETLNGIGMSLQGLDCVQFNKEQLANRCFVALASLEQATTRV